MKELKIEAGKFYRTRDGRKSGIYRTDVNHHEYSIHGYVIELNGDEYSVYWRGDGRLFNTEECVIDLIEKWQDPLDFDWGVLPPWCNKCVAMDKTGAWYAFSNEPKLCALGFYNHDVAIEIPKEYQPKNFTGDWTDSIFKNPNLD